MKKPKAIYLSLGQLVTPFFSPEYQKWYLEVTPGYYAGSAMLTKKDLLRLMKHQRKIEAWIQTLPRKPSEREQMDEVRRILAKM